MNHVQPTIVTASKEVIARNIVLVTKSYAKSGLKDVYVKVETARF